MLPTNRKAGLELCSALTHTHTHSPSLADFNLSSELRSPRVQANPALFSVFPDICSTFPFCVAGKGSGMEKALPRPLQPHGKGGEQSVRSPPATVGHICGQLSPRCSLRRCAAPACLCTPPLARSLSRSLLAVSHALKSKSWSQEQPEKMHFLLTHYVPVPPSPPLLLLPFPDYLY